MSRRGRIYGATDVSIGQPSMREYAPLIVGYVHLPEGIRIFAQLDGERPVFSIIKHFLDSGFHRNDE